MAKTLCLNLIISSKTDIFLSIFQGAASIFLSPLSFPAVIKEAAYFLSSMDIYLPCFQKASSAAVSQNEFIENLSRGQISCPCLPEHPQTMLQNISRQMLPMEKHFLRKGKELPAKEAGKQVMA